MLDDDDVLFDVEQGADDPARLQPLLDVEVRRRLVEHVHVRVLHRDDGDGEPLQLAAR